MRLSWNKMKKFLPRKMEKITRNLRMATIKSQKKKTQRMITMIKTKKRPKTGRKKCQKSLKRA